MAIAGLHNVSVLDSPFLRDSHSQASGRQADEARDIIAWLIFLFRILSLMIWPTFLLFACSVPNHRGKMKIQKEAWKKKKLRKLKNLFVLCPVNKLFRSYHIPSLQQQTIQKVSMHFFFLLFNYRFKLYKLPTNHFSCAKCNFIGFFFYFWLPVTLISHLFIFFSIYWVKNYIVKEKTRYSA